MAEPSTLLLILLLIHVLADFSLPWKRWFSAATTGVHRARALTSYVGIAGLGYFSALALTANPLPWAALIALSLAVARAALHGLLPRPASYPVRRFILEQGLSLLAILGVWAAIEGAAVPWRTWLTGLVSAPNLLIALAYLLVLRPTSSVIGAALAPWIKEVDKLGSLANAGALIGNLERVLILTFVLLQQWEAVGFLITAKSILRFNDIQGAKVRSLSEYVLLGTLLSFTLSIAIGLAVTRILAL